MSTDTTEHGYPYPLPDDPVTLGAQRIQELAEAVDAAQVAAGLVAIACGSAPVPVVGSGAVVTVTITFPAGRFSKSPTLAVTPTQQRLNVAVSTINATGATINVANWTGIATGAASGLHWIATVAL